MDLFSDPGRLFVSERAFHSEALVTAFNEFLATPTLDTMPYIETDLLLRRGDRAVQTLRDNLEDLKRAGILRFNELTEAWLSGGDEAAAELVERRIAPRLRVMNLTLNAFLMPRFVLDSIPVFSVETLCATSGAMMVAVVPTERGAATLARRLAKHPVVAPKTARHALYASTLHLLLLIAEAIRRVSSDAVTEGSDELSGEPSWEHALREDDSGGYLLGIRRAAEPGPVTRQRILLRPENLADFLHGRFFGLSAFYHLAPDHGTPPAPDALPELLEEIDRSLDEHPSLEPLARSVRAPADADIPLHAIRRRMRMMLNLLDRYATQNSGLKSSTSLVAERLQSHHPELEEIAELEAIAATPEPLPSSIAASVRFLPGEVAAQPLPAADAAPAAAGSGSAAARPAGTAAVHGALASAASPLVAGLLGEGWTLREPDGSLAESLERVGRAGFTIPEGVVVAATSPLGEEVPLYRSVTTHSGSARVVKFPFERLAGEEAEQRMLIARASYRILRHEQRVPRMVFIHAPEPTLREHLARAVAQLTGIERDQFVDPIATYEEFLELKPGAILAGGARSAGVRNPARIRRKLENVLDRRVIESVDKAELLFRAIFPPHLAFAEVIGSGIAIDSIPSRHRERLDQSALNDIAKLTAATFLVEMLDERLGVGTPYQVFTALPVFDLGTYNALSLLSYRRFAADRLVVTVPIASGSSGGVEALVRQALVTSPTAVCSGTNVEEVAAALIYHLLVYSSQGIWRRNQGG